MHIALESALLTVQLLPAYKIGPGRSANLGVGLVGLRRFDCHRILLGQLGASHFEGSAVSLGPTNKDVGTAARGI